ncbi:MAG: CoA transferase [Pseudomonadales bacterium]
MATTIPQAGRDGGHQTGAPAAHSQLAAAYNADHKGRAPESDAKTSADAAAHRGAPLMFAESQPFHGIRVVEFGQFVAVPFCGQLLAEGGAEVIKVESPEGDPNRLMGEIVAFESRIFVSRNRGKHCLPIRLSDSAARPVVAALAARADVVLMNFRPGLAAELGLDPEALLTRHPRLIVGEITPFGKAGPDAGLAGMDIVVQARSGLMAAMGRVDDGRPTPGEPVITDYMAAMSLAFGVSAALYRRERTGRGGMVDVSLMQAAMTLANNQLIRQEDLDRDAHRTAIERLNALRAEGASFTEQMAAMPSARMAVIRALYFRTYDTADGSIAVACASRGLQTRFARALGFSDPSHAQTLDENGVTRLQKEVEAIVRRETTGHWLDVLQRAGVPASSVRFPVELFEDAQAMANGMFELVEHETAGRFRVLSPPVKLDGGGFTTRAPAAPFGSETRQLLGALGMDEAAIQALIDAGTTRADPAT